MAKMSRSLTGISLCFTACAPLRMRILSASEVLVGSDRIAIRHAGNVVGDDPGTVRVGQARRPVRKLGRHQCGVSGVGIEQIFYDGLRTPCHLELLLVS